MDNEKRVRMDQWLAAVRIFKTRSQAAEACRKGHILVNDMDVKPSHVVKLGEIVGVKSGPIIRTFLVKGLLHKRVSARIAIDLVEETTAPGEIEKLRLFRSNYFAYREKGSGRPTKRERRKIDRLKGS